VILSATCGKLSDYVTKERKYTKPVLYLTQKELKQNSDVD
jgi:hypothetical protein